ncbi:Hypp6236 [Branchiostoma lanceolatum]|uniref:Hypp6236 protein n=1 Tax=Branchiostoma lanceolatum TaxID=7740 RepID=A0A8J9VMK0_BRALA|nr:Hypp6236 [Branchiostoma lanceolatum]
MDEQSDSEKREQEMASRVPTAAGVGVLPFRYDDEGDKNGGQDSSLEEMICLFLHFEVKMPEGAPARSTEGIFESISMGPAPFQLCAVCSEPCGFHDQQ